MDHGETISNGSGGGGGGGGSIAVIEAVFIHSFNLLISRNWVGNKSYVNTKQL